MRVSAFLVNLNILKNLDGLIVIAEERVQTKQADKGKVAEHLVQRMFAKSSGDGIWISAACKYFQLALDLGLVDEIVKNVQDAQHVPYLVVSVQILYLLWSLVGQVGSVLRERLKLVDKFVYELPEPLVRKLQLHWLVRIENVVKQVAVVVERAKTLLQRRTLTPSVYVTVVKLLVQDQKYLIILDYVGNVRLLWPGLLVEELLRYLRKRVLIEILNLEYYAVVDAVAKVDEKLSHDFGHLLTISVIRLDVLDRGVLVVCIILQLC